MNGFYFYFNEIEHVGGSSSVSADSERIAAIHFLLHLSSSRREKKDHPFSSVSFSCWHLRNEVSEKTIA